MTLSRHVTSVLRSRLARTCLLSALALTAGIVFGQKSRAQSRVTAAPTATGVPVRWDSLFRTGRMFELRDGVLAWKAPASADSRLFRGLVAHAFNDNDNTITLLRPLVDSTPVDFGALHLEEAVTALGASYLHVSRYREAAEVFGVARKNLLMKADTAARSRFAAWESIATALSSAAPQRVVWNTQANGVPLDNAGVPLGLTAAINDDSSRMVLGLNPAVSLSMLDSGTAARHGIVPRTEAIRINLDGAPVPVRAGVVSSLDLATVTLANVPVLIVPDAYMRAQYPGAAAHGILGLPVLSELGSISYDRDGRIGISSPGSDVDTSSVANMVFTANNVVVRALYAGNPVNLALDARQTGSVLYPDFLKSFPSTPRQTPTTYTARASADGPAFTAPGYVLGSVTMMVGGRALELHDIPALLDAPARRPHAVSGVLGQDALRSSQRLTLDFSSMTARVRDQQNTPVLPRIVYPAATRDVGAPASTVPEDIAFVALLFALFVIPKALQRYRLPSAITSLLMGAGATALGLFHNDPTLHLLSTFGIVALFLFAGLDIDGHQLRADARQLVMYGVAWVVVLGVGSGIAVYAFGFAVRPAFLIGLAILTPSTGFILSSLPGLGLHESERFTVKTHAIASELLALTVLFVVLQSTSPLRLVVAIGALLAVIIIIPLAFRLFARLVAPHAPRSEFAFLLMVAIVCAYATRKLGVYYLVGAFLVGVAAQRFRSELPAMSSEKMVDALESFGSVFIPFYFFHAGTEIVREQLSLRAMAIGLALVVLVIPVRIGITILPRRIGANQHASAARRVGFALVPTLVFTLVIVNILGSDFGVAQYVLGALVLYTVINTTIPAFVLKSSPPQFENVEAAELEDGELGTV
ncbi:MAG: cation:proton antiporter [Gemmatimonadota bacterium]|nr:cation:proton antiporter [Gemmatimonadota bacterium]